MMLQLLIRLKKVPNPFLWKITDIKIIDGAVNGTASLIGIISKNIRKIQTGVAQFYALVMMLGIVIALFWIILSFIIYMENSNLLTYLLLVPLLADYYFYLLISERKFNTLFRIGRFRCHIYIFSGYLF